VSPMAVSSLGAVDTHDVDLIAMFDPKAQRSSVDPGFSARTCRERHLVFVQPDGA
jgi:hypothetical protein